MEQRGNVGHVPRRTAPTPAGTSEFIPVVANPPRNLQWHESPSSRVLPRVFERHDSETLFPQWRSSPWGSAREFILASSGDGTFLSGFPRTTNRRDIQRFIDRGFIRAYPQTQPTQGSGSGCRPSFARPWSSQPPRIPRARVNPGVQPHSKSEEFRPFPGTPGVSLNRGNRGATSLDSIQRKINGPDSRRATRCPPGAWVARSRGDFPVSGRPGVRRERPDALGAPREVPARPRRERRWSRCEPTPGREKTPLRFHAISSFRIVGVRQNASLPHREPRKWITPELNPRRPRRRGVIGSPSQPGKAAHVSARWQMAPSRWGEGPHFNTQPPSRHGQLPSLNRGPLSGRGRPRATKRPRIVPRGVRDPKTDRPRTIIRNRSSERVRTGAPPERATRQRGAPRQDSLAGNWSQLCMRGGKIPVSRDLTVVSNRNRFVRCRGLTERARLRRKPLRR